MSRPLLAGLALATLALPAAPAAATGSDAYVECDMRAYHDASMAPDTYRGVLQSYAVITSADGTPASAVVTCELRKNGVPSVAVTYAGTGVAADAEVGDFTSAPADHVRLCVSVDYTSDDTPTESYCFERAESGAPPQEVHDLADQVGPVRTVGCLATSTAAPYAPGVWRTLQVYPDGDVEWSTDMFGGPLWSCP